ncbi:MAG TPA: phage baseplate protein, partial [Pseudomonadota bacterium]|nr:phage baseplate protein [Pseudomonadota bacterium]
MWSEEDMLRAWEQGEGRAPVLQAQALLQAGYPQQSLAQLDSLTVGQRDGLLFALRERAFGSLLQGSARCPACGERSLFS